MLGATPACILRVRVPFARKALAPDRRLGAIHERDRADGAARRDLLDSVNYNAIAGVQAVPNDPLVAAPWSWLDVARADRVAGGNDVDELAA